jgi:hypothetical protein
MDETNVLRHIVSDDMYNILCKDSKDIEWPVTFNHSDKILFIDNIIKTLEMLEEYGKCNDIYDLKISIQKQYESSNNY